MSPTVSAILFGIVWIVLSTTLPAARRGSMRSTTITTVIGVAIVAALDWLGLFPTTPPDGPTTALVVAMMVAFVVAVIVARRRQRA